MQLKLGKLPPVQEDIDEAIQFTDLVPVILPVPPSAYDGFSEAFSSLGIPDGDDRVLYPMYGNGPDPTVQPPDSKKGYGNCVLAAFAKFITSCAALVGKKVVFTANQVIDIYLKLSGGDNGPHISRTIDYAIANGLLGEKPVAKVYVDPTNLAHVQLASYLFKFLVTGIQCTDQMQQAFKSGGVMDGTGTVMGGHGIVTGAYGDFYKIKTWGGTLRLNDGGWAKVDELWVVASQEMVQNAGRFCPQFAGNLLDAMQTIADQFCCYRATCATVYDDKLKPAAIYQKPSHFMGEPISNCPF